jgi:hypothetical protein
MQVDSLSLQTEIAIRAMSPKEREWHIKEGLCFICRNKGHMSGECPKKENKVQRERWIQRRKEEKIRPRSSYLSHIKWWWWWQWNSRSPWFFTRLHPEYLSNDERNVSRLTHWFITIPRWRKGFLTVGHLTVDNVPETTDSTQMDSLDISHVTVHSISKQRISVPIRVETGENTENLNALIDCRAEGLFIDKRIAHK